MSLAKVGQKVKITNCQYENLWYKDYIGQEFVVEEVIERKGVNSSKGYYMLEGNKFCGVEEIDCIVIKEEQLDNFKSGDKVITTAWGVWYETGEVFTLTKPYKDYGWYTLEKGEGFFVHAVKIKHYNQPPKDMLQNGMRIKCRNGLMYTYIDGYFTNISVSGVGLTYLSEVESWSDDLRFYKNTGLESEWDVMEIYAKVNIYDYFNNKIKGRVIWEREEKSESEKELEILQQQIESLTQQAIKLGEQIKMEKQ